MLGYALAGWCSSAMENGVTDRLSEGHCTVNSPSGSDWYSQYQSPGLWNTRQGTTAKYKAQLGRGQLKLAISYSQGHLTVHVMQARQLGLRRPKKCSTFIKINLLPDNNDINRQCETEVVYDTNHPTFDEKFTFELMEEDKKKRLLISIMDKSNTSSAECLGCMSFGVRHLTSQKKEVNSWYYLLSEDVGRRKHLQVTGTRPITKPKKLGCVDIIPQVNKAVQGMENVSVVLKRGKTGFGFTVMGSSPVTVGRVDAGSSAESAGVQKGDSIVRINGLNVSRSTADSVAKVVKNSPRQMVLDVYRVHNKENIQPAAKVCKDDPSSHSANKRSSRQSNGLSECSIAKNLKDNLSEKNSLHSKLNRIEPEINAIYAEIGFRDSHMITMDSQLGDFDSCLVTDADNTPLLPRKRPASPSMSAASHRSNLRPNTPQSSCRGSAMSTPFINHIDISKITAADDGYGVFTESEFEDDSDYELDYARVTLPELSSSSNNETCSDDQQAYLEDLISCEEAFVQEMQAGIQAFSRPLRHCVLTPQQHARLFQNVEKLSVISEFHLRALKSSSDEVGTIYKSKVLMLCEAYEHYCGGISDAFRLLSSLNEFREFTQFNKNIPESLSELTLESFLQRPIAHLHNLTQQLESIRRHTSQSQTLDDVIIALQRTCLKISQLPEPRLKYESVMSLASVQSRGSVESRQSSRSRSSTQSATSVVSTMSVDSEVLEIQSRLLFPKHLQAIPVASANRHLIYAGELMWIVDGSQWQRVYVVLFNDLLLVVQPAAKNYWTVIHNPVQLTDVISADFSNKHPSQFSLSIEPHASSTDSQFLTFRAFTIEQKCTWKNLLEQRISACRSQRELMSCRTSDIII